MPVYNAGRRVGPITPEMYAFAKKYDCLEAPTSFAQQKEIARQNPVEHARKVHKIYTALMAQPSIAFAHYYKHKRCENVGKPKGCSYREKCGYIHTQAFKDAIDQFRKATAQKSSAAPISGKAVHYKPVSSRSSPIEGRSASAASASIPSPVQDRPVSTASPSNPSPVEDRPISAASVPLPSPSASEMAPSAIARSLSAPAGQLRFDQGPYFGLRPITIIDDAAEQPARSAFRFEFPRGVHFGPQILRPLVIIDDQPSSYRSGLGPVTIIHDRIYNQLS